MHKHHEESIANVVEHFQNDPEVEALLLGGSIAHGFETPASDVDVMILISDQRHAERSKQDGLIFVNRELCTYKEGYVDGKYIGLGYLKEVAAKGSEPARFAFQGARVLFSRQESLEGLLREIERYPIEGKAERLLRFAAQLEAWHWYVTEALRHNNRYLLWHSISKLVLFGGRLILTHNDLLYPYHKWFMRALKSAPEQPPGLFECIESLYQEATAQNARRFYELIKGFREWGILGGEWPARFLKDSELNWKDGMTPVDDL
jgi:predicted nucleotidyltransferase